MGQERIRKQNNAGFSLLEVVLAMAILAIISLPLLQYFSSSAKYNAMMKNKQKATIMAQELTENLKSQKGPLIQTITGPAVQYGVPYLENRGYRNTTSYLSVNKGTITYNNLADSTREYDVEVKVSTAENISNTSGAAINLQNVNDAKRDLVYGLDYEANNLTDVVAQEQDQRDEAIIYFSAISDQYIAENEGLSPVPKTDIQKDMTQTFHIDISGTTGNYNVRVWVEFKCLGLRGTDALGNPTEDTYLAPDIVNVARTDVKNIYLIYDKISNKDSHGIDKPKDEVSITNTAGVQPNLILYCQEQYDTNPDVLTQPSSNYGVNISGILSNQAIYTNIRSYSIGRNYGFITVNGGASLPQAETLSDADLSSKAKNQYTQPVKETGTAYTSNRPVKATYVEVTIYKKNHNDATDQAYVSMTTTKGE